MDKVIMSDDSIRYLHLSDFHVGKDEYAQRKLFPSIVEHIHKQKDKGLYPDLIFVTGDIANKGEKKEYQLFNDEFLLELEIALGDDWQGKIFIVPGNHDVDRKLVKYIDRDSMVKPGTKIFDPTHEGKEERMPLIKGIESYQKFLYSTDALQWLESEAGTFSEVLEIKGNKLGIVGINTAWLSKDNQDRHNLSLGINLLENAFDHLPNDCKTIILLGHHPLDWFKDQEIKRIRGILGKYQAIYLHGHMHESWIMPAMSSAGRGYLCVQSGASFQARDGELWCNGLLWGEVDFSNNQLLLQPYLWSPDHQAWVINNEALHPERKIPQKDWWTYPLPASGQLDLPVVGSKQAPPILSGWSEITKEFLDQHHRELEDDVLLRFFDGSTPNWLLALHPHVPKRGIVKRLAGHLSTYEGDKPQVVLLLGAGGEGKSTACLQTITTVAKSNPEWRILWNYSDDTELLLKEVLELPKTGHAWLLASDDADLLFRKKTKHNIFDIITALHNEGRNDIHFLFACRDTDWRSCGANMLNWHSHASYQQEILSGLNEEDAIAICNAWSRFGERGLGRLVGKHNKEIVRMLLDAAIKEAETEEGAFLGAMLKVRIGDRLKDHVLLLLRRLEQQKIKGSGLSLINAFAYIAAMHAEKQMFLSKQVMAEMFRSSLQQIRRNVIFPLGKEAAASAAGNYIYTRHRTIAQVSLELLRDEFGYDIDGLYVEMAEAAISARVKGEFVPNLHDWDYKLPQYFLNNDRKDLTILIGKKICEKDPLNTLRLINLAKMYRDMGEPHEAAQLFLNAHGTIKTNRGFYFEWATSEGNAGNTLHSIWLCSLSLADQIDPNQPNNKRSKLSLAGLGVAFMDAYEQYHDPVFLTARGAVAQMGLNLDLDPTAQRYLAKHDQETRAEGIQNMDIDTAIAALRNGTKTAWLFCGGDKGALGNDLLSPVDMTFLGLQSIIQSAANRKHKTKNAQQLH